MTNNNTANQITYDMRLKKATQILGEVLKQIDDDEMLYELIQVTLSNYRLTHFDNVRTAKELNEGLERMQQALDKGSNRVVYCGETGFQTGFPTCAVKSAINVLKSLKESDNEQQ